MNDSYLENQKAAARKSPDYAEAKAIFEKIDELKRELNDLENTAVLSTTPGMLCSIDRTRAVLESIKL